MSNLPGAPLYQALAALADQHGLRFHIPGHKGRGDGSLLDNVLTIDYTEIPATGNLYGDGGVIQYAEELAARYYGMDGCYFLTCGATQGIKAAIASFCKPGDSLVVDRNCHISVFDACALLDLQPYYVLPEFLPQWGVTGEITVQALDTALAQSGAKAAIVTCPTYYGMVMDIDALVQTAHRHSAVLIVDAAHGAHLLACGLDLFSKADAVILSAHKTLSAMTQGAYLLFAKRDAEYPGHLRGCTALFGTTSPSYPLMASLDLARHRLEACGYENALRLCKEARTAIEKKTTFKLLPAGDPCRLVIRTAAGGLSGHRAAALLRLEGVEVEMSDEQCLVCVATEADTEDDFKRLISLLEGISGSRVMVPPVSPPPLPVKILSPRQGCFGKVQAFTLLESAGKIAAQSIAPYPPGVPVVTFGEKIDKKCIEYLIEKGYNDTNTILCRVSL